MLLKAAFATVGVVTASLAFAGAAGAAPLSAPPKVEVGGGPLMEQAGVRIYIGPRWHRRHYYQPYSYYYGPRYYPYYSHRRHYRSYW